MRGTVINELERLAEADPRISIITADFGYGVLESFAEHFPTRCFNVGISEQLMTSAAAGMALCGNIVITYALGNFATLRCIEQIRNDVCYHNANVKIIAGGGGMAYGQLGMSHHATEDIAMMRMLPNMRVLVPADPEEALASVRYAVQTEGPCYIRLARGVEPILYHKEDLPDISRVQRVRTGSDVALLLCGPLLKEGLEASKLLEAAHISASVFSVPCVKPLDAEMIQRIAADHSLLVTAEEHMASGGLGSAVAEVLCDIKEPRAMLLRLGLQDVFPSVVGNHDYVCDYYGLSGQKISDSVMKMLR